MRGGGCMKIPNRTNGVDIPHTHTHTRRRTIIRNRRSIVSAPEMNLKKIGKKRAEEGGRSGVLDAISLALGVVGFSASTATTGMLLPPGLTLQHLN